MDNEPAARPQPRKRTCFQTAFDLMRAGAERALAEVPELRSVVVVADWEFGAESFPPAAYLLRKGEADTPAAVHGRLQQLIKAHAAHLEQLHRLAEVAARLAAGTAGEKKELPPGSAPLS